MVRISEMTKHQLKWEIIKAAVELYGPEGEITQDYLWLPIHRPEVTEADLIAEYRHLNAQLVGRDHEGHTNGQA